MGWEGREWRVTEDHFIEKTEVDADRINDPERPDEYACESPKFRSLLLRRQMMNGSRFSDRLVP
jgi:hypothetical protein